jgi:hypothetical protein
VAEGRRRQRGSGSCESRKPTARATPRSSSSSSSRLQRRRRGQEPRTEVPYRASSAEETRGQLEPAKLWAMDTTRREGETDEEREVRAAGPLVFYYQQSRGLPGGVTAAWRRIRGGGGAGGGGEERIGWEEEREGARPLVGGRYCGCPSSLSPRSPRALARCCCGCGRASATRSLARSRRGPTRRGHRHAHGQGGIKKDRCLHAARGPHANFFKKRFKKIKFEKGADLEIFQKSTSRPTNGREAWGRKLPAHPTGGRCQIFFYTPPESLFVNKKLFIFAKRPLMRPRGHPARPKGEVRGSYSAEGHPARWVGGRFPSLYISPHLPPKFLFYSSKIRRRKRKGGEEERRGSGEALHTGLEIYSRSSRIIT